MPEQPDQPNNWHKQFQTKEGLHEMAMTILSDMSGDDLKRAMAQHLDNMLASDSPVAIDILRDHYGMIKNLHGILHPEDEFAADRLTGTMRLHSEHLRVRAAMGEQHAKRELVSMGLINEA